MTIGQLIEKLMEFDDNQYITVDFDGTTLDIVAVEPDGEDVVIEVD